MVLSPFRCFFLEEEEIYGFWHLIGWILLLLTFHSAVVVHTLFLFLSDAFCKRQGARSPDVFLASHQIVQSFNYVSAK